MTIRLKYAKIKGLKRLIMGFLQKISAGLLAMILLLSVGTAQIAAQDIPQLDAYALDTIAGFPALIKVQNAHPYSSLLITVEKPDGSRVVLPAKSDQRGSAQINLYELHTRAAGTYTVTTQEVGNEYQSPLKTFTIYEDDVSKTTSRFTTNSVTAKANGKDTALLSVRLRDVYENPIPNHLVKIVSSRASDTIKNLSKQTYTDVTGESVFAVSSDEPGLSTYTAIDVTSGITLADRVKVAYFDTSGTAQGGNIPPAHSAFGTSVLQAQAQTAGPIAKFAIQDLPSRVAANSSLSFKVVAQDTNGLTVKNYTGSIKFAVTDSNATLPPDYNFTAQDLGNHIFNLGLRFVTPGTHTLSVVDVSNRTIKGEFQVTVDTGGSNPSSTSSAAPTSNNNSNYQFTYTKPKISSPTPGTYKKNQLIISGTADSGAQLKVFDNGKEIAQISADQSGTFRYQIKNLSDAAHQIKVGVTDGTGKVFAVSDPLDITVDSKAPSVDDVVFQPRDRLLPDTSVIIKVYSEKDLAEVAAIIDKKIIELQPDLIQRGAYTATLRSPAKIGAYPVDIIVVDKLGNEGNYKNKATLTVISQSTAGTNILSGSSATAAPVPNATPIASAPISPGAPTKVTDLIQKGSDSRVTLYWKEAQDDKGVAKYKVFYGIEKDKLIVSVNTFDTIPAWYIPNLTNGQKYYFAVAAIDNEGKTGPLSDTIEGTPLAGIPHPLRDVRPTPGGGTPTPPTSGGVDAGLSVGSNGQANSLNPPGVRLGQNVPLPKRQPETGPAAWLFGIVAPLLAGISTFFTRQLQKRAVVARQEPRFYRLDDEL